ncbi:ABC transporter permease [Actinomyces sp. oral taxon 414]|uniref:amino acid ABC transporter permease n=1 Tax=Actinomyces sp. oral taxon 414 TaxID=712122 RepID=UPI0006B06CE6|nr:amino acid ABC transporter permease [Actinomyces sp. oral taxon 414]ALC98888.1 ABC transporter permease [Actinomyces sp. oral taxon 414]
MRSILAARRLRPPVRRPRPAADASLLFDEPGPRGRRRIAVISVMVSVVVLGLLAAALYELALQGQLAYPKWRYFLGQSIVRYLGTALASTLLVTVVSAALSFPLGVVLGWARLGAGRLGRAVVGAWIDAMRAVPMLLLIYFFLLAVPNFGPTLPSFWMLVIPIVMCTSATTAEVFRSGVLALDRGQSEAATALGLSRSPTMRLILAPQALRIMLPTLVTQLVTILKDSSLGYVVSYAELMYAGSVLIADTRLKQHMDIYLPTYVIIAALYVVINWGLGALARVVEARSR